MSPVATAATPLLLALQRELSLRRAPTRAGPAGIPDVASNPSLARFLQLAISVWPTIAAEHRAYSQSQAVANGRTGKPVLALLIASDLDLQMYLRSVLRAHGHAIVCASDLEQALAVVRQASPHLVIAVPGADLASLLPHLAPSTAVIEICESSEPGQGPNEASRVTLARGCEPGDVVMALQQAYRRFGGPVGPSR